MDVAAIASEFTSYARSKLNDGLRQIERCLNVLTPEQVWHRPNDVSNAVGNLVLHLTGNVRLWINSSLGGEAFQRDRPAEFAQRAPLPTEEILRNLIAVVTRADETIGALTPEALLRRTTIQGYDVSGLAAIFHAVEHFSLHTGQIVYATKLLIGEELSVYDQQGRRLDGRERGTP